MAKEKQKSPILTISLIFAILILASAIILGTFQLTGKTINFPSQNNNPKTQDDEQPIYNPSIQPNEDNKKDWESIIAYIKTKIKVEALQLGIPISNIEVFTESFGKPFQVDIQWSKNWKYDDDYRDIFCTRISQLIKDLELRATSVRVDSETETIYFYIK